jgi:hypothetical protein
MAARSPGGGPPRSSSAAGAPSCARFASARLACALAAGVATIALATPARADDAQAFELAKNPFDAGQYAEAHARLSALFDASLPPCETAPSPTGRCRLTSPELVERARALDAASLLALKRDSEADALIALTLRQNPDYAPSPAMFPPEVIDRFTIVRGSMAAELRAIVQQRAKEAEQKRLAAQKAREAEEKWITEISEKAAMERWVEPNSRWIAMVPFGIGQFQNGDTRLGITFAVGETLLGGASLVSVFVYNKLAPAAINGNTAAQSYVNSAVLVNRITFAAWAALTLGGVIQAQVAFVPEKVTFHKRPIPPRPKIAPVAAPLPGGAVIGLTGTF